MSVYDCAHSLFLWGVLDDDERLMSGLGVFRKVFVSFGGLLLYMDGSYKNLTPLRIDYVYLCIKR